MKMFKKLIIKSDYIYLLVDSTDKLVSTSVNTVQLNGKTKKIETLIKR